MRTNLKKSATKKLRTPIAAVQTQTKTDAAASPFNSRRRIRFIAGNDTGERWTSHLEAIGPHGLHDI